MAPRTILYTGKGGVGKTSVAAASARACAAAGLRTVVLSTDPAHSLSDSLESPLGPEPTQVEANLFAQEVQAQEEMERNWHSVQAWLGDLLAERGIDRISAEELTVPPGMDELFSLLWIKRHHEEGEFDCVIVDCAPTGETLRLLSFPDVVTWWLERLLPSQRKLAPFARTLFDMPLPGDAVFADLERLARNLVAMNGILRDRARTSIRLVTNPDRMVVKEAMRTFTYLNLYGYLTDAVVVNRLLPSDGYFAAWREVQEEQLALARSAFDPVPVLTAAYYEREVMGAEMLDRLASEVFDGRDPAAILHDELTQELVTDNGRATLRVAVPFAERDELSLKKIGLEVIVRAGTQKRTIMLPPALAGLRDQRRALRGRRARDRVRERRHRWRVSASSRISSPRSSASSCSRSRSLIDWYLERLDAPRREPEVVGSDRLARSLAASARPEVEASRRGRLLSLEARQPLRAGVALDHAPHAPDLCRVGRRDVAPLARVASAVVEAKLLAAAAGDQEPAVVPGAHEGVVGGGAVAALATWWLAVEER